MAGDRQLRRKRCRGNLRPAPFCITPETVGKVLALAQQERPRAVQVPVLPVKLVDRPRRSEDPRLARANDIPESTPAHMQTVDEARDRNTAPAAAVTSEGAGGGPERLLANAGEALAGSDCTRDRPSYSAQQIRLPMHPLPHLAGEPLPQPGPSERHPIEVRLHRGERPPEPVIRAAAKQFAKVNDAIADGGKRILAIAEQAGIAIRRAPKIDWARLAAAHAAAGKAISARIDEQVAKSIPLQPAPSREECPRCGIPGFKGCAHFLPCEPVVIDPKVLKHADGKEPQSRKGSF